MKKYRVQLKEVVYYAVEVEAENEDDAMDIAEDTWAHSDDPTNDFCGEGQGVTVRWVEEIK